MGDDNFSNKDEAFQAFDDIPLSPANDDTMGAVIAPPLWPPGYAQGVPGRDGRHGPVRQRRS